MAPGLIKNKEQKRDAPGQHSGARVRETDPSILLTVRPDGEHRSLLISFLRFCYRRSINRSLIDHSASRQTAKQKLGQRSSAAHDDAANRIYTERAALHARMAKRKEATFDSAVLNAPKVIHDSITRCDSCLFCLIVSPLIPTSFTQRTSRCPSPVEANAAGKQRVTTDLRADLKILITRNLSLPGYNKGQSIPGRRFLCSRHPGQMKHATRMRSVMPAATPSVMARTRSNLKTKTDKRAPT